MLPRLKLSAPFNLQPLPIPSLAQVASESQICQCTAKQAITMNGCTLTTGNSTVACLYIVSVFCDLSGPSYNFCATVDAMGCHCFTLGAPSGNVSFMLYTIVSSGTARMLLANREVVTGNNNIQSLALPSFDVPRTTGQKLEYRKTRSTCRPTLRTFVRSFRAAMIRRVFERLPSRVPVYIAFIWHPDRLHLRGEISYSHESSIGFGARAILSSFQYVVALLLGLVASFFCYTIIRLHQHGIFIPYPYVICPRSRSWSRLGGTDCMLPSPPESTGILTHRASPAFYAFGSTLRRTKARYSLSSVPTSQAPSIYLYRYSYSIRATVPQIVTAVVALLGACISCAHAVCLPSTDGQSSSTPASSCLAAYLDCGVVSQYTWVQPAPLHRRISLGVTLSDGHSP